MLVVLLRLGLHTQTWTIICINCQKCRHQPEQLCWWRAASEYGIVCNVLFTVCSQSCHWTNLKGRWNKIFDQQQTALVPLWHFVALALFTSLWLTYLFTWITESLLHQHSCLKSYLVHFWISRFWDTRTELHAGIKIEFLIVSTK